MPYNSVSELPERVRKRLRNQPKRLRQWLHVFNSTYSSTEDEGRAFAAANSVVFGKKKELKLSEILSYSVKDLNVRI